MHVGRLAVLVAVAMVTMGAPSALADGIEGPDPLHNGGFSVAVEGTPIVPGWSMHAADDPSEHWAVADRVDGDMKVRTLGEGGHFGGPTNLGFSMERPTYSLLYDELTFEVTDRQGEDLASTGLDVMVLAEWTDKWLQQTREDPTEDDPDPETSVAIYWNDPSSQEAREGLTLANADGVKPMNEGQTPFAMTDFSEEELANGWTLGAIKIDLPQGQQLLLDDFEMTEPTLFGTYR